jgi:hypothetical protein
MENLEVYSSNSHTKPEELLLFNDSSSLAQAANVLAQNAKDYIKFQDSSINYQTYETSQVEKDEQEDIIDGLEENY